MWCWILCNYKRLVLWERFSHSSGRTVREHAGPKSQAFFFFFFFALARWLCVHYSAGEDGGGGSGGGAVRFAEQHVPAPELAPNESLQSPQSEAPALVRFVSLR